jgi:hypothetical protein
VSSGNGPRPPDLHAPPGFAMPGQRGEAAPDSVVENLRRIAARKRQAAEKSFELPGWEGVLRATFGVVGLDEMDRLAAEGEESLTRQPITRSIQMLARACKSIEAKDTATGKWQVLEDDMGPVGFDDRLARVLEFPRPDPAFKYQTRDIFIGLFDGSGLAISRYAGDVGRWMGMTEEEVSELVGESSTGEPPKRSESPPPSDSTPSPTPEPVPLSAPFLLPRSSTPPNTVKTPTGGWRE